MGNGIFQEYLKEIYQKITRGDAREESFYGILESLIFSFGKGLNKKTAVTALPKKSEAGNPDFRIWDGESKICGYIEAKSPSIQFLDEIETTEQLKRYKESYPNLILTNFFEFRLFRNGELICKPVKISDYFVAQKLSNFPIVQREEDLKNLLRFFFDFSRPRINSAKTLAEILAIKAKDMRDLVVLPTLKENNDNYFYWLYNSFKNHLIKDLLLEDFADYFSQTFVYGLLIAKYQYEGEQTLFGKKVSTLPFTTKTAYDFIQKNFGILREVFKVISTEDMPKNLEVVVDEIVDILNNTEIYKIISAVSEGKRDPVFHLYETFLSKFDSERKIKLGVFYTPLPVVSYIINSTNSLLQDGTLFDCPDGLASFKGDEIENSVTVLDPAVGTGTFLVSAIEKAIEVAQKKYSSEKSFIKNFIREHILSHFFAFEISIAPYVVSHLKVLFSLTEKGFNFNEHDHLNIFLTNTLEFNPKDSQGGTSAGMFERVLVTEQENALEVKNSTPIMIVIGNPPYSVSSQNEIDKDTEFGKFYESYKENVREEEKNIQPLSDDYIKFLAFAHWKVRQSGKGIVAMITNNSFLDGLIHRDMRRKLIEDFDQIYILNLHGDLKRSKRIKEGTKDENVFDIRQGVSVNFFVKSEKPIEKKVFYQELIDSRDNKYLYLESNDINSTGWNKLIPKEPYFFFVPKNFSDEETYQKFFSLRDMFSKFNAGIATGKDNVLTDFHKDDLLRRLSTDDKAVFELSLKNKISDELINKWYEELHRDGEVKILPYCYRPFDIRFTIYNPRILQRARSEIMDNFLKENIAIDVTNTSDQKNYNEVFISNSITDKHLSGQQTYVFPLWLYENRKNKSKQQELLEDSANGGKSSNIKQDFIGLLNKTYGQKISPGENFYYIYAILYSNSYRTKYTEFLKIDFPKIPFTNDYKLFKKLQEFGQQLAELHLLNSQFLDQLSSKFEGNNDGFVKKPYYNQKQKRVYINEGQYFTNVESDIWNYYIGGYQVLDKWLQNRKGRMLLSEDIKHYYKVITTLSKTIDIQKQIDKFYPEVEKKLI